MIEAEFYIDYPVDPKSYLEEISINMNWLRYLLESSETINFEKFIEMDSDMFVVKCCFYLPKEKETFYYLKYRQL